MDNTRSKNILYCSRVEFARRQEHCLPDSFGLQIGKALPVLLLI